ncbi:MAG: 23S rRNA (guanosine(2251)-2'-O)-methyltransferase RlmB [Thermodesulfobacteriota bacterium]
MSRIIYGINPVLEAIRAASDSIELVFIAEGRRSWVVGEVVEALDRASIPWEHLHRREVERLAGTEKHQGVAARIADFKYSSLEQTLAAGGSKEQDGKRLILILDGIQDPQNLGALIRSGNGAGVDGIIIPKRRAAEVTPVAVKASAGAAETTRVAQVTNIAATIKKIKEENIWVVGVEGDATNDIYSADLRGDLAIVIGSEGGGIRRLVRERCDELLSIPMGGSISSLNASVAGAVVLFEALRQRRSSHPA